MNVECIDRPAIRNVLQSFCPSRSILALHDRGKRLKGDIDSEISKSVWYVQSTDHNILKEFAAYRRSLSPRFFRVIRLRTTPLILSDLILGNPSLLYLFHFFRIPLHEAPVHGVFYFVSKVRDSSSKA